MHILAGNRNGKITEWEITDFLFMDGFISLNGNPIPDEHAEQILFMKVVDNDFEAVFTHSEGAFRPTKMKYLKSIEL